MVKERKITLIHIALLALVFSIVFYNLFDPKLHIGGDNASYITLARSIADGDGYSQMHYSGELRPASHFPPGYSFILAIFMTMGIDSLIFFKVLNGLFFLASLVLLYFIISGCTGNKPVAFAGVMLAVFSPQTLSFATIVMSEMSFMFFVMLGFFGLYKYSGKEGCRFYRNPWFYIAVVSIAASYYIRSVGMAAVAGMLLFFLFRKEWKQAFAALGGFIFLVLPWSLRNASHGIESRYFGTIMTVNPWRPEQGNVESVGDMINKMMTNFDETVIKGFREILFPWAEINTAQPSGAVGIVLGLIVLALVIFGAYRTGRMRWAFLGYLAGSIGLFMLWHGGNGTRYVTPIAPLLFVFFYNGIFQLADRLIRKNRPSFKPVWLPYAFLIMIIPAISPLQAQAKISKMPYPPAYVNYFRLAEDMNKNLPAGTVVIARKPELFAYYAPRLLAVNYKYSQDPDEVVADILKKNADYVILEQLGYSSTALYLWPSIEANQDIFAVVGHLPNPDTYLLAFDKEKAKEKIDRE